MDKFNDDFFDNLSKFDVPFCEYFKNLEGHSIRINHMQNELYIMDENQIHRGTISMGRSAKSAGIDLSKLLKQNLQVGDYSYGVLLNGFNNKDWLFAVQVVHII